MNAARILAPAFLITFLFASATACRAAGVAVPATLPDCATDLHVKLNVSFGKTQFVPYECALGTIGVAAFGSAASDVTGNASLKFSAGSIELDYHLTQPCLLTTYGVLYNDNVLVQIAWGDRTVPASVGPVPVATAPPIDCGAFARPTFPPASSPSPSVPRAPSPLSGGFVVAAADATKACQSMVNGLPADPAVCSADAQTVAAKHEWSGSLKLSITALQQAGVPPAFSLRAERNLRAGVRNAGFPTVYHSRTIHLTVDTQRSAAHQQYVAWAPTAGHASDTGVQRRAANVFAPLNPNVSASATFADDAGAILATRDKAVADLMAPSAPSFGCHSCGAFFGTDKQPFQSPFASRSGLGVDLSAFGVDGVPFATGSVSYPIDSGYKLIVAAPPSASSTTAMGLSWFDGTTKSSGYAHDSVVSLVETVPMEASSLKLGLFHVVANRSVLATPAPSALPPVTAPLMHSANTQGSVAYSFSPEALHVLRDNQSGATELAIRPPMTYTTLLRYGTQYVASSQIVDVAESIQRDPPSIDPFSTAFERWHVGGALGYRSVGAKYNPIDGTFDAHIGERGPYATLEYTAPVIRGSGFTTATVSVSGYLFTDGIAVRDQRMFASLSYPLSPYLSLQSNDAVGHLTISQVARANGFIVADAAGGRDLLANSKYNLQLTYKRATVFQLTGGYTMLYAQGCNTRISASAAQPCYPYRAPTAVGDLAWVPFDSSPSAFAKSLFVEGSVQDSASSPFRTATDAVLQTPRLNYYDTTAGHVVRTAAVGAVLFKSAERCSTLLLTTANRGGDIDNFAKSAPVAGYTNTASLESVLGPFWPTLFVAYNRTQNKGADPARPLWLIRAQFGVPPKNYGSSARGGC